MRKMSKATRVSCLLRLLRQPSWSASRYSSTCPPPPPSHDVKSPDFAHAEFKGMSSHFPCLDRLKEKQNEAVGGITGMYGEKVQGYKTFKHVEPFYMKYGGVLPQLELAYEEWGQLNEEKNNVILLHTGLSGSSHAKSSEVRV